MEQKVLWDAIYGHYQRSSRFVGQTYGLLMTFKIDMRRVFINIKESLVTYRQELNVKIIHINLHFVGLPSFKTLQLVRNCSESLVIIKYLGFESKKMIRHKLTQQHHNYYQRL